MNHQTRTRELRFPAILSLFLLAFLAIGAALPRISRAAKFSGSVPALEAQVQLASSTYEVMQDGLSVTLTVIRVGDTSTEATVDYSTYDDSATQRRDYIMTAGTLTFAPGESSKSIAVLIIDDAYPEVSHSFWVTLSNPLGMSMGAINNAAVSIVQATPPDAATNPLDGAPFFVREHYFDFLDRLPDQGGLDYWVSQIENCGVDQGCINQRRVEVSNAFFFEGEFQQTGSYIYRVYKTALGTNPSYQQFMESRNQVLGGAQVERSKSDFANDFVLRADFLKQFPVSLTAAEYVDGLNANTGNALTKVERAALINLLNMGDTMRGTVLLKIAENKLFTAKEYNATFVLTQYFGYLRRDLDQAGFDFWLGQINKGANGDVKVQQAIVCSFVTSREYQERFSSAVSHNNSECAQ